jgi:sarcosine oxidase
MRPDVIVVGLGSMGAAAAAHLAGRGVRVLGLDSFTPPHSRGAHAGGSRIIRMAYAEGAEYVPLVRRAYQLWAEVEKETGTILLTTTGGLMLGPPGGSTVGGALASARIHGLPHELLDPAEVRRRFPAFTPAEGEIALYEEVAGLVRPETAIEAHLRLARLAGADLRYGVTVTGWRATSTGISVATSAGELSADRLVIAPGAWAPALFSGLSAPLVVQRRVQHYWRVPGPEYEVGRFPVWIWEYAPDRAAYGLPAVGGSGIDGGAKAALHQGGETVDPDVGAGEATPAEADAMRAWLADRLPGLARGGWLGAKPCLYTLTPDEHFILGPHPEAANVSVAGGFSGHGFKFAPVVGEILADLALTGRTRHPIGLFDPGRFG